MELNRDDWVETVLGQTGKVVSVGRMSATVDVTAPFKMVHLVFLEIDLTKIEAPTVQVAAEPGN